MLFLGNLFQPIHGAHIFRQTHVAANIEHFMRDGVFSRPAIYNHDEVRSYFDTPIYQWIVAIIGGGIGADPVVVGRIVNVLAFVGFVFLIDRTMARLEISRFVRFCTLAIGALAPLTLSFGDAILPDPLAIGLAFASLYAFFEWERSPRLVPYLVMLGAGVLATLIKNPIYFPVAATILAWTVWTRGLRALARPEWITFVIVIAATVAGYTIVTGRVNHPGGIPADEWRWYFGSWGDRGRIDTYAVLARSLGNEVLNPVLAALALVGLAASIRNRAESVARLVLVLVAACVLTMLVFVTLHYQHDYYQLPFVFPMALAAAYGLDRVRAAARGRWRLGRGWDIALLVVLALVSLRHSLTWYGRLSAISPRQVMAEGAWLRSRTSADDFVVYVHRSENLSWNPAYLYFAKREGFNLVATAISRPGLQEIASRFGPSYRRVLVFCPAFVGQEPRRALDALGLEAEGESGEGKLYVLEN